MKIYLSALLSAICLSSTFAQLNNRIPTEKPKLVVGIIIEQMRYDFINRYWDKFGDGGFKRLINEGTNCKNANFNYLFTQTSVGHATIATGTTPSYHGIVADEWYLNIKNKVIDCVADDKEMSIGGDDRGMSPRQMLTTTMGDEIRLANFNKSKVIGISLQAKSAILSTGSTANAAYWFDDKSGNWITSSFYMKELPKWVEKFNDKKLPEVYMKGRWESKYPLADYATRCLPDDNKYEMGLEGRHTFPYNFTEMTMGKKKSYSLIRNTPYGNIYTEDFAIASIVNDSLGKDENTDMLMISFSATEFIGQNFGSESVELMDAYIRLDETIEHLLNFIDSEVGKRNTLVFLTSDHGMAQNPEYLANKGVPVDFFNPNSSISLLKSYMNAVYGKGDWIKNYYAQQIYLNHDLIEDSKLNLAEVQQKVAQFMLQVTGVANTVTSSTMQSTYFPDGVFSKIQKSYNQKRSGDVMFNLEPGWIEKSGATDVVNPHNSSYSYDTHVPLVFYGWKVKRASIYDPIDMTDVAPSICQMLNIASPNASNGKPIVGLVGQ